MKLISIFTLLLLFAATSLEAAPLLIGRSEKQEYLVEEVASGLGVPWGMAFVAHDQLLFTERRGQIRLLHLENGKIVPLSGGPEVFARGQGGMLDVAVPPGYQPGDWIYFTYSRPQAGGGATALARARLGEDRFVDWQDLLSTEPVSDSGHHFGSRIAFDQQGHLFFTIGDRGDRKNSQNLGNHAGTVLRLRLDGTVPTDNPSLGGKARPEIWSYGHRNAQGIAYDPEHHRLWLNEHGPRGGDEINLVQPGGNYGWPVVSHGMEYWGPVAVGQGKAKAGMVDPVKVYIPSIAPGSLLLYTGKAFPAWRGNLFSGALRMTHLNRVVLDEAGSPLREERLLEELAERIRALIQSPEGWLYLSTDSGRILRLRPTGSL